MPKRRRDADSRRFLDEFEGVKIGRFRAMGVVDPMKPQAVIPFPNGKSKLLSVKHTRFPNGGGWSYFVCPGCQRRASKVYLIDDAARCAKCCNAMNIKYRSRYGFGRAERIRAGDESLDRLIAKLETEEPLRLNGAPKSWGGKAQLVYRSKHLTKNLRRRMISLRLSQLASQQANENGGLSVTRACKPRAQALALIPELKQAWRARSTERLQQALDKAQTTIFTALKSDDPQKRSLAANLMLKTKQARERGFTAARK